MFLPELEMFAKVSLNPHVGLFENLIIVTTRSDECNFVHQRRTGGRAWPPNINWRII